MPQYLLSVWHDEPYDDIDFSSPDMQRVGAQVERLQRRTGESRGLGVRHRPAPGVVRDRRPRRRGTDVSMTDGPYAETKEQMGGFWIIEAADLDAALDWAGKAAAACEGPVEVRPTEDA